jgi:large subunit ribosomal protein L25
MAREIPTLPGEQRQHLGSKDAHLLRKAGRIPAVIYGHQQDPLHVSLDAKKVSELVEHHAHLVKVNLDAGTEQCLLKELQWDYLGSSLIHVDLERVSADERVTVSVGIEVTGEAVGLKEAGAFLEQPTAELEIECLATDIPELITVDVSELKVGETLTVADLKLPEGVKATADPDMVIAAVHMAAAEEEEAEVAAGTEEPEVIGRKPGEEGEEA